jgi:hypothetical protein
MNERSHLGGREALCAKCGPPEAGIAGKRGPGEHDREFSGADEKAGEVISTSSCFPASYLWRGRDRLPAPRISSTPQFM